jgi:cholesterol transport system auxiliary component
VSRLPQRRRFLWAASCVALLPGCSSVLPEPPAPRIYRLNPVLGGTLSGPPVRAGLAIALPSAPQSLDTDRIALTRGPTRFEYYAESIWTDRLPALLNALLVESFENSGRVSDVERDTYAMTRGYVLQTDIREFEARYADLDSRTPEIVIVLDLRLTRGADGPQAGRTLIDQRATSPQNNMDSIVAAFDMATAAALRQAVTWTLREMARPAYR